MFKIRRIVFLILFIFLCTCAAVMTGCSGRTRVVYHHDQHESGEPAEAEVSVSGLSATGSTVFISFDVTAREGLIPEIRITVSDQDNKKTGGYSAELAPGSYEVQIECSRVADTGETNVRIDVYWGGKRPEIFYILKLKDGLPQLSADSVRAVVAAMTDEEKCSLVTGVAEPVRQGASGGTYAIPRLGVSSITVNDGPQGVRYGTTVWYPSVCNVASSWDRELAAKVGGAIGDDALGQGIDIVLGPGMNVQRGALGGRNFEYCSEDPLLTGIIATWYVYGMQSSGAGACLKHFAANDQETNRGGISSDVSERALREIYLKGFELAVKYARPVSVMSSYNLLNGVYTSINRDLLNGILRDEWGYEGFVMSDWGAAGSIVDKVNALNDINMPGNSGDAAEALTALADGRLDRAALDRCCEDILLAVAGSATCEGRFEMNGGVKTSKHSKLSGECAADTFVLLKNEDSALPFAKGSVIYLFGDGAFNPIYGGSGSGGVAPSETIGLVSAIEDNPRLTMSYSNLPKDNDAAMFVISRGSTEGEDNEAGKGGFELTDKERSRLAEVTEAFHKEGKKVIVLLNTGNPIETASWRDSVDAILWCGYPGQRLGEAVVRVLTGEVNPSGKTVISWPETLASQPAGDYYPGTGRSAIYYEDIYVGYRYYETFGVDTAFPFGFGLSYTTFEYTDFEIIQKADGMYEASVTVTNTGSVAGREVVEFYVSKPETHFEQPALELAGFAKTDLLKPGRSEKVIVYIGTDALKTYDTEGSRWVLDNGVYTFYAGSSCRSLTAPVSVERDTLLEVQDVENRCVPEKPLQVITKSSYTPSP